MNMENVKKVYHYKHGYSIHVMKNNTFEVVSDYNTILHTSNDYKECDKLIKSYYS